MAIIGISGLSFIFCRIIPILFDIPAMFTSKYGWYLGSCSSNDQAFSWSDADSLPFQIPKKNHTQRTCLSRRSSTVGSLDRPTRQRIRLPSLAGARQFAHHLLVLAGNDIVHCQLFMHVVLHVALDNLVILGRVLHGDGII